MIDYKILADSVKFYEEKGFIRIETPWTVSQHVDEITKPEGLISYQLKHNNKCLVASGEQSFLYLYLKNFLPKGRFQTITPCFRHESFDELHMKYFMKNELIQTDIVDIGELNKVVDTALEYFRQYFPKAYVYCTSEGYDIFDGQVELGSYGIRTCEFLTWIYGTGCAEPRMSNHLNRINGIS